MLKKSTNANENNVAQKTASADISVINKEAENKITQKNALNKSTDINNSVSEKDLQKQQQAKDENTQSKEKISAIDNAVNSTNKESGLVNSTAKRSTNHNKKSKSVFEKIFEKNYRSATENNHLLIAGNNINKEENTDLQRVSGFGIIPLTDKNISSPDINNKNLNTSVASFIKTDSSSVNNKKNKQKDKNKKQSYFYAGLSVAPDLSTVKFQSIKGTGYTAGILLGYNISRKIAVETGAYYDYKKYYTEGQYFHSAFANLRGFNKCEWWLQDDRSTVEPKI